MRKIESDIKNALLNTDEKGHYQAPFSRKIPKAHKSELDREFKNYFGENKKTTSPERRVKEEIEAMHTENNRPKCPHCMIDMSPAGGLVSDEVKPNPVDVIKHWKCRDCGYEIDESLAKID